MRKVTITLGEGICADRRRRLRGSPSAMSGRSYQSSTSQAQSRSKAIVSPLTRNPSISELSSCRRELSESCRTGGKRTSQVAPRHHRQARGLAPVSSHRQRLRPTRAAGLPATPCSRRLRPREIAGPTAPTRHRAAPTAGHGGGRGGREQQQQGGAWVREAARPRSDGSAGPGLAAVLPDCASRPVESELVNDHFYFV